MTRNLASETVLFVDDEKSILNALKREMIDEEYQCLYALSGNQALQIMQKEKVSVIISDMKMPEMDGLRLLKLVREKYPSTVRIVLSGYTQLPQILVTINQAEVFKFLTKPWGSELKLVILEAINYHQMQEDRVKIEQLLSLRLDGSTGILSKIENIIMAAKSNRMIQSAMGLKTMEMAIEALDNPEKHTLVRQQLMMASSLLLEMSQTDFEEYRETEVRKFCESLRSVLTKYHINKVEIENSEALSETIKTMSHILCRFITTTVLAVTNYPHDYLIKLKPNIVMAGETRNFELTCLISSDSELDDGYEEQRIYIDMLNKFVSEALVQLGGDFQSLITKGVIIMKFMVIDRGNTD